ncbi:acyl-CoA dehydrogenase family protein [Streptomyces coeruleofuscus]|uniref:Acyl-CoA dehydrogenase/oxidase C-terminal domain-containing protein n=1 Tax=Streptomyces coeruleofuscus TaxID=66879 RepID=A0ABN3HI06_9ACTN
MLTEPTAAQRELVTEFRRSLARSQDAVASAVPRWAGLTVPAARGGHALGQMEAVLVAEETGRAGRDGTLLDLTAAAEALAAADEGPAADALRDLLSGRAGLAVSLCPGPDERPEEAPTPRHRDFVSGLPATAALLRLPRIPGGGERFALVPLHAASWRPHAGLHAEPRHRLDLPARTAAQHITTGDRLTRDSAGTGDGTPALADLDGIRRAGYLCGLAEAAVDAAVRRARDRRQFGTPIGRHQAVAFPLAALTARLHAARLLTRCTAALADHRARPDDGSSNADDANDTDKRPFAERVEDLVRHTTDLALDATWCGLHLHGAQGLTEQSPAQLLYRRALFHTALARPAPHPYEPLTQGRSR